MGKYDDIISMDRPRSAYPKMKVSDRAKQFAPFAALTGYEDVIEDRGRVFDRRRFLSDEEKEKINSVLSALKKNDMVSMEYFAPESDDDLGFYKELSGKVERIETENLVMRVDGITIDFEDIFRIRKLADR
ncbi:MAG: hypothetical protein IJG64_03765 [Oscillospiraceae bacterium]|nr:hypothetical protein [Oscillospiraceae bacterium]